VRDRPVTPDDPLTDAVRERVGEGTRLASDVAAIDAALVPAFRTADEQAVTAQNRWARRELGLLVLSALLVVASSVQAAYGAFSDWPGVVVAVLGGLSSVLAGSSKSADARGIYLRFRREAERLRSLAWTHLALPTPTDPAARTRTLRKAVARIRLQTVEGAGDVESRTDEVHDQVPTSQDRVATRRAPGSETLVDLYLGGRLEAQRQWYRRRQAEFDAAERQGGRVRTALLIVATMLGAVSSVADVHMRPWLGVAATVVTAASALTTGWMRLQAFDTRARLYELTAARLDVAEADRPPRVDAALAARYISQCEDVLLAEHGAWTTQTPTGAREPLQEPETPS
jgi:hypothetical protein